MSCKLHKLETVLNPGNIDTRFAMITDETEN